MEVSGFILTVMGMGVVFLALTLLAFTAWLLERIFRTEGTGEKEDKGERTGVQISQEVSPDIKAVITLALAYQKRKASVHIQHVHESMWMQQTRVYE